MGKTYDIYNLEDSIDAIIEELSCECDKSDTFVRECYEALSEREGFIDYARENDDSLFCSCLYDLVDRRIVADSAMEGALEACKGKGYRFTREQALVHFNVEPMDQSIDYAIYRNYGSGAKSCLTPEFISTIVPDEAKYEHSEFSRAGKRVLFKGHVPVDVFEEE